MTPLRHAVRAVIRLYQWGVSPWLGVRCRFVPSCSHYALEAVERHGAKGLWLAAKRVARCHPWGGQGHDPVPPATDEKNI